MNTSQLLEVSSEVRDGGIVVTARGELDMATTPELAAELVTARRAVEPPEQVVVDLRKVGFLGADGISCLLDAHNSCAQSGTPFRIIAAHSVVLRPLSALELDSTFQVAGRVEDVLTSFPAQRETPTAGGVSCATLASGST